jgi:hypothetical protein
MPVRAELAKAHDEEEAERRKRFGRFILAGLFFMIAAVGLQMWLIGDTRSTVHELQVEVGKVQATQEEIQQTQAEGKVRGLKLRAIGCRNVELQGGTFQEGDPCTDAELEPYFTPQGEAG